MRLRYGIAGWVSVDDVGLPGTLHLRVAEVDGRLAVDELHLDANDDAIHPKDLRTLPLGRIMSQIGYDLWVTPSQAGQRGHYEMPDIGHVRCL